MNVVHDIRDGLNVIITSPAISSVTERVLAPLLRPFESLHFVSLDAANIAYPISESLHQRFSVHLPEGQLATPGHLAERISDRNVIFVAGVDATNAALWLAFLNQYQHGCNGRSAQTRSVFCIAFPATCGVDPKHDAVLSLRRFEAEFCRIDGVLQMEKLLMPTDGPSIKRDLIVSMGAEIAGCDSVLAQTIAEAGDDFLTSPGNVLLCYGRRKKWSDAVLQTGGLDHGVEEVFNGVRRWHSSVLVLREEKDELFRRLWHGQIRVLFPFIEEQRISLADTIEQFLRLPVTTHYGTVSRAVDLELSEMIFFLQGKRLPSLVWDDLQRLKRMRNDLAHRRPIEITAEDLRFFSKQGNLKVLGRTRTANGLRNN